MTSIFVRACRWFLDQENKPRRRSARGHIPFFEQLEDRELLSVTFFDGTFNNSDWTANKILDTTPGLSANFVTDQVLTGGNPGSYRQTTQTYPGPGSIVVGDLMTLATYNPSTQGAVSSINSSFDMEFLSLVPGISNAVAYGPLLYQAGNYYSGGFDQILSSSLGSWQHFDNLNLTASQFNRFGSGPGLINPDFSAKGLPFQIGYYTSNGTGGNGTGQTVSGIDNWLVTINNVSDQLVVTTQPPDTVAAGNKFDVTFSAENSAGNVDTSFTGSVTIALGNNPGVSTLGGTLTVNAVNGVSDFPDLTLDKPGNGYTLQASSNGLSTVTTHPFNVGVSGLDVSQYQESINWPAVAGANRGQTFVIIRATEGTSFKDRDFTKNITRAIAAGMVVGAYHFANPDADKKLAANPSDTIELRDDADAEADHFAHIAGKYLTAGSLQPALDLERDEGRGGFNNNFDFTQIPVWATEWIAELKRDLPGVQLNPILYMNQNYAENFAGVSPSLTNSPLWIAAPNNDPNFTPTIGPWNTWAIMQWSQNGTLSGISGPVDLDVVNPTMSLTSLEIAASQSTVPTNTTIQSSANASVDGQLVRFTANVTSKVPGARAPTGAVKFQVDGQNLGAAAALTDVRVVGGPALLDPISTASALLVPQSRPSTLAATSPTMLRNTASVSGAVDEVQNSHMTLPISPISASGTQEGFVTDIGLDLVADILAEDIRSRETCRA